MSELDQRIAVSRDNLNNSLTQLADLLHTRFCQRGALVDLEEALALQRRLLELRPPEHPDRALSSQNVASLLSIRFDQLGATSDLEEALALERSALALRPQGHPDRANSLSRTAYHLSTRFKRLGALSDLEGALALGRSALELRPPGDLNRATSLSNVSSYLFTRFRQLGALSDLEEALVLERTALVLRPHGYPYRATSLSNIASYLSTRFRQLGELSDLEEALVLGRSALELRPHGHPYRAASLGRIAEYLHVRFKHLGRLSDLEEALALERSALELRPQGHPRRCNSLYNLASYLSTRFHRLGGLPDLEEALVLGQGALELRLQGHPDRASSLGNLACCFHTRFKHSASHDIADLQKAFHLYSQLADVCQVVFLSNLQRAKQWIEAAEEYGHNTTVLAYQTFIRLSGRYLATLPSLPQHLVLLKQLMKSTAVDAFSACVRDGNLTNAIELLEQGRCLFWGQLMRLRPPLGEVIASGCAGKELADKFTMLASSLQGVLDGPLNAEFQHDRAFHLNVQLQDVVVEIRKLPGLSHFLKPLLFSDLQAAADGGPVIIVNASQHSCDALVLLSDQDPIHVPLRVSRAHVCRLSTQVRTLTSRAKFMSVTKEFVALLREVWDMVVFPIVKVLQESCPHGSRIWWCPTAEFFYLPLHAAGAYRNGHLNVSDLYVSSYTPSLMALIRARQRASLDISDMERHRFLIVGQAQAPGQSQLFSVSAEVSNISERIASVAAVTRIQDQDAVIAKVGDELTKTHFVHFACHGIPNRKHPFDSGFELGDGLLKVDKIMRYHLQSAQFAYLSACHTTVGDEDSPDEAIHLAAAMQFAGFRSVIGTMWAVDDEHAGETTSKFYAGMQDESGHLDPNRAAQALHATTRSLFSRSSVVPFDQRILYVHIGP